MKRGLLLSRDNGVRPPAHPPTHPPTYLIYLHREEKTSIQPTHPPHPPTPHIQIRRTWVEGEASLLNNFMGGKDPTHAKQLAIGMSGPQQEAYVGGFS